MSTQSPISADVNARQLELALGDIAGQQVDAIVNAANSRLAGGGGVDGAIHRAGGPAIMEETAERYPDGCPTGSAVISAAGNLPAKYVIHAVGPVWNGGRNNEDALLAAAYITSLELAAAHRCDSVALPALSTGAYRFPAERASWIAISTAVDFLNKLAADSPPQTIRFVLFSSDVLEAFRKSLLAKLLRA